MAVDEQLEGIKMRLRPSMNKFRGREDKFADIEIARAFTEPNTSHTNRCVISHLYSGAIAQMLQVDDHDLGR